ncbi:MAG: aminomethyl-transferring glycine dehydrogenase subunit GcvPA [Dehalococcoidia bacterium]|nr:aminomethyl-transferring glycine dehydrogenase subunit GcvPA [Dehalococcoidia bacterium]
MLKAIGVSDLDELFADIPGEYRNPKLDIPSPLSELELRREMGEMAAENLHLGRYISFLGAGAYNHFSPSVVKAMISRGEFLTAYTPYQPEASQGTLQATYDFQTMVCNLLGMEVADAGMYDGASALAEAALMSCRITGRGRVAVLDSTSPTYREVISTYISAQGIDLEVLDSNAALEELGGAACLIVQYPNFLGYIEDMAALEREAHSKGAMFVVSADPFAMGLLRPPGEYGADIVTGEGQALGLPVSFGGPYVGLFASRMQYLRQMPGRIAGETTDTQGRTGYVLTLSTREQHIRREKATSNICTNQALMSLAATIYMAALGRHGLRHMAELCYHKAHYAASAISQLSGYSLYDGGEFFQEFTVKCPRPASEINAGLLEAGIIGGLDVGDFVGNGMLLCVTEVNSRGDIDRLVEALAGIA